MTGYRFPRLPAHAVGGTRIIATDLNQPMLDFAASPPGPSRHVRLLAVCTRIAGRPTAYQREDLITVRERFTAAA